MNEGHLMSRRRFLGVTAGAAAATAATAGLGPLTPAWSAQRLLPRQKIGVMLYTVRDLMSGDAPATLALMSEIGYREVELGALFGRTPAEFRSLLDANRLRAIGGHQWTAPLLGGSNPEATLDAAETLGLRYSGATALSVPEGLVPGIGEPHLRPQPLLGVRHRRSDGQDLLRDPPRGDRSRTGLLRARSVLDHLRRQGPPRLPARQPAPLPVVSRQGRQPESRRSGLRRRVHRSRRRRRRLPADLLGAR
jgi:hypothetical protein